MEFLELVNRRQSCRSYSQQPVSRDLVEKCLEAARLAPSACNSQPWSFSVIDQEPLRGKVAEACSSGMYFINKFAKQAPVLIAVVTERSKYIARLGGKFRGVQYSLIDIGIAGEHFDLQAAELGLGCCWLGWFDEKAIKKLLKLPADSKVDVVFTLGYPSDPASRPKKRKALDEIRMYQS